MQHAPHLPGIFNALAPVLDRFGYFAVVLFLFLEDFGVPVPGETTLIAAAVYAGAGVLNVWLIVPLAILAAMLGDNVGYALGRFGGRVVVERWGRYIFITPERLATAEAFFAKRGGRIVVIARFIEGLRQANGIIAGITEMPWPRFLLFNAIGAALWVGVWVTVGMVAGANLASIYHTLTKYELVAAGIVVLGIVALIVRSVLRNRGKHHKMHETSEIPSPDKSTPKS